jgi:hypothetical protein
MPSIEVTAGAAIAIFVSALLGFALQRWLPEKHTTGLSRDIIGGVVGMLVLLLALVLGLLIWTAYGVTSTQKTELQVLSARALEFDLELKQYGPEAEPGRNMLRTEIVWAHEQFWGEDDAKAQAYAVSYSNMASMSSFLNGLKPATDAQRQLLGAAAQHYAQIGETRLLMSLQLVDPISWPLIFTVIAWSCLLFCGFGVLSRLNVTTMFAAALGACAVSSALFLILELSQPYTSLLRVSPAGLEQTIVDLAK